MASTTVALPDGNTVAFSDTKLVTYGERRELELCDAKIGASAGGTFDGDALADALLRGREIGVKILIESWSYPFPIPREDPSSLNLLPSVCFDAIAEEASPLIASMFLDTKRGAGPAAEPDRPTLPSNG